MDYQGSNLREFLQTNGHVVLQRADNNYNLRSFTLKEIEDITNGYCTVLGEGGFGEVYKGKLDDERPVAVKRYKNGTKTEEFAKEVIVHSQINHKNVVRLLGCCTEENALMIVMEFICNGNLYNILHCSNGNGPLPFPLEKRLDIAIQLAEVLSCMHSMYSPVLHGDIKPANILLDENYLPKISDFGIARLLSTADAQHTNTVIGPIGYMDPLYTNSGKLTPKSDVYSFGVVLLELITRKKAVDGNTILTQSFNESLRKWKKMRQLFDEEITNERKNIKLLEGVAKLVADCLKMDDKNRPEMVEVADKLRAIRKALQQRKGGSSAGSNFVELPSRGKADDALPCTPASPTGKTLPTVVRIISLDELKKITGNFRSDALIGNGLSTSVFHGVLENGQKCAVKKLDSSRKIRSELLAVSRVKHANVVQLLGYCMEEKSSILVYEYATGGSLHNILHGIKGVRGIERGPALSWTQRVKIALSAAEGLEFLHEKAEPPVIHGAIKSSNILLFDRDVSKIGDLLFGRDVAKIGDLGVYNEPPIHIDNIFLDRLRDPVLSGYEAPECEYITEFNKKSDIYSFGVVLLELVTGRKALDYTLPDGYYILARLKWGPLYHSHRKVQKYVDPRLEGDYPHDALEKMTALALLCVQHIADERPSMSIVLRFLRQILDSSSIHLPSSAETSRVQASSSLAV